MTKNRLITFGCSLTYGQYLDDPSSESWPAVLSDLLNLDLVNQSINGASAKRIWWEIVNFNFYKDDIVVILWTHLDRWCIIRQDQIENLNMWDIEKQPKTRTYYEHIHNDHDMLIQYLSMINHTKHYLASLDIKKQIHLTAKPIVENFMWNQVEFAPVDMSVIRKQFPKAQDNNHPGDEAHKEFAKQVYRYYIKGQQ